MTLRARHERRWTPEVISAQVFEGMAVPPKGAMGSPSVSERPGSGPRASIQPRFTVDCKVGRLVEARLFQLQSADEVSIFQAAMRDGFRKAGPKSVICADWRPAGVLSPEVAEGIIGLLRVGNAFFERSAILLAQDQALFGMQVERVVREARNPSRRTFRDSLKMRKWLAEVLDAEEVRRMNDFFREFRTSKPEEPET
jgi:hypothetical protein